MPIRRANPSGHEALPASSDLEALHRELGIPASYAADRALPVQPIADIRELVELDRTLAFEGRSILLLRPAAEAWQGMQTAAAKDHIELIAISGFRSVARQKEIIRAKLGRGESIADILRLVAAPGFSEHHTGRAVDLGCPGHLELESNFEQTAAFDWLRRNASDFGFWLSFPPQNAHGITYESWHWCWQPRQ